ncbi:unnamed protein product [Rotaria magnacalcarata]|uniref:Uncharacterized protein n=2 Tax=Rotaria magnacalcarata TaxID=392030 RepID=A0A820PSY4_9BILA|nr:unnamed protein product [Rotaria magnacalcarata]
METDSIKLVLKLLHSYTVDIPSIAVDIPSIAVDIPSIAVDTPSIAVDIPSIAVNYKIISVRIYQKSDTESILDLIMKLF